MRRLAIAVLTAAAVGGIPPAAGAAPPPVSSHARTAADHHCPVTAVLVDKRPLLAGTGRMIGAATLFSDQSTSTEPPSPGFCLEVALKPRFRKPVLPVHKKLTVTSPPDVVDMVGTVESAHRQFPLGVYDSSYNPGCCTAVGKVSLRIDRRKITVYVRGAL